MAASGETLYSARTPYPDVLQLGRDNVVSLRISRSGSAVAPTAGTFSLISPGGSKIVDAQAITVVDSVATFTVSAATLSLSTANVTLDNGYQEVWTLTLTGETVARTWDREAAIARRPISPSLTVEDLLDEYAELNRLRGATNLQSLLEAAWGDIVRRWIREGGLTYTVKSHDAFFEAHRELVLMRFWRNMLAARPGSEGYDALVEQHRGQYEAAWAAVNVTLDLDGDGEVDDATERTRRGAVLQPNVPPSGSRGYSRGYGGRIRLRNGRSL